MLNHIFANWKTSLAGLLISMATICGVLASQGVTLGHAGTGTVVTLIAALATALLGLMAKDPEKQPAVLSSQPPVGSTQKLGVFALAVFLVPMLWMSACKAVNAPLPANAINATDAGVNETLQAAHAGAAQFAADVQAGKFQPTAAERSAYNAIASTLNVADPLYQQWHAALAANPAATEPQQLVTALTTVAANLQSILTAIGAK